MDAASDYFGTGIRYQWGWVGVRELIGDIVRAGLSTWRMVVGPWKMPKKGPFTRLVHVGFGVEED